MKTKILLVGGFLGAGKTTLLWEAASRLVGRGQKVALITNDQASELVDSALLRETGLTVAEVSGSCFCCNFNGFVDAIAKARAGAPDVILAEPVGSCADLSATILQPLKKFYGAELSVAPFTVLADPARLRPVLDGGNGDLHEDAAYIFRKQLEEADVILLTKNDLRDDEDLEQRVRKAFPGTDVRRISCVSGEGIDAWLDAEMSGVGAGLHLLEIDYDRYAHGEAVLGWLNGTVDVSGSNVDWDAYAARLMSELQARLVGIPVGHVKIFVGNGEAFTVGNFAGDGRVSLRYKAGSGDCARVTVNARVQTTPEALDGIVRAALAAANGPCTCTERAWRFLQPGRPAPTHRFAEII